MWGREPVNGPVVSGPGGPDGPEGLGGYLGQGGRGGPAAGGPGGTLGHWLGGPAARVPPRGRAWLRPVATLLVAVACGPAAAADAEVLAGKAKAQACAVCHGVLGLSTQPDAPSLAGQPAFYLAAQLRAYRSGARKHEVMAVMAKPLSDDDITKLAAWFSAIKVEATAPP